MFIHLYSTKAEYLYEFADRLQWDYGYFEGVLYSEHILYRKSYKLTWNTTRQQQNELLHTAWIDVFVMYGCVVRYDLSWEAFVLG